MIYLAIALFISLALNGFIFNLHIKQTRELHIRLASKSQQEAEYWLRRPKEEKKEEKKEQEKERELGKLSDVEKERKEMAKGF